jgi:hypothetical protein
VSLHTRTYRPGPFTKQNLGGFPLFVEHLEDRTVPAVIPWDGGAGTFNWADAANWVGDTLPASSDEAVIDPAFSAITVSSSGNVTIQKLTSAASILVTAGTYSISSPTELSAVAALNQTGGTLFIFGQLTASVAVTVSGATLIGGRVVAPAMSVLSGGVLTHPANTATQTFKLDLDIAGTLAIDATSRVDVSGRGYLPGRTTGNTTAGGATGRAGGSHGGIGATLNGGSTTAAYGDYAAPGDWGAGGAGTPGGGVTRITAGSLLLDGQVLADGAGSQSAGNGAGGSVYVAVGTLAGAGSIQAAGGPSIGQAIGGSGGRVAVYARDFSSFDTTKITALGGTDFSGAGSVYLRDTDDLFGTLVLDNRTVSNGVTVLGLPGQTAFAIPDAVAVRGPRTLVRPEHAGLALTFQRPVIVTNQGRLESPDPLAFQDALSVTSGGGHVQATVLFDGTGRLTTQLASNLTFAGDLLGNTTLVDLYTPLGGLVFSGGSAATPRQLEVMSRDLGTVAAGYSRNFAYGSLQLSGAYVRLVDQSDNVAGAGAEAVYVDTLVVPAGSTLDLNGFKVYSRATSIQGTVVGGTVTTLSANGPLVLNQPASGAISVAGEIDQWTFFGRAGDGVRVRVTPAVVGSSLAWPRVTLLDPGGAPVATLGATAAGEVLDLVVEALPADGVYTVHVQSTVGQPTATGGYRVGAYTATIDTRSLILNQTTVGHLETPYSLDRWTFTADANSAVRFDLVNAGSTSARFRLTGPNGFVAFTGLTGDSDPVTLPATGPYTLEVASDLVGSGSYSFRVDNLLPTPLAVGTPFAGTLSGTGYARLFRFDLTQATPLTVLLDDATNSDRTAMYLRLGAPPTRQAADHRAEAAAADQQIQVPLAAPGTWYLLVYGTAVPAASTYTLRAVTAPVFVTAVTPDRSAGGQTAAVTVRGAGFVPGSQVALVPAAGAPVPAQSVSVDSFGQITAAFNLIGVPQGAYGVRVTLPSGATDILPNGFQVLPAGQPRLETRVIVPSALGRHATLYMEYANTGTAAMPAPILTFQSGDADGSDRPILTLDAARLTAGFWTSTLPDGFGNSVQVYASGATPGLLLPGETIRVPVYYAGLQQPWNFGDGQVEFEIRIRSADDPTPIDWTSFIATGKPEWVAADAWAAVMGAFVNQVGTTWGDYVRMLSDNATYLSRLGRSVANVNDLYGFEFLQANGISALNTLESVTDAEMPTAGVPLSFGRRFANTITERYSVGPFGRGWSSAWFVRVEGPPAAS